jgi:hypothetical protein
VRPGTVSPENEKWATIAQEEFLRLDLAELAGMADKLGVSLQGVQNLEQARTRLLNDAVFIG